MTMQMPRVFMPAGGATDSASADGGENFLASWVRQVEDGGIDGVFVGDHVTFYGSGSDGLLQLATIAAVSKKLYLQTCVYLLALRHPTPVALQAAMVDRMAGGRLIVGVGIGGEDPNEWWACGVDPKTRARRTDESMQILRSLWTQEETTFAGKYFNLNAVRMRPKPRQPGGIPLWVGGRSDAALRRTGLYGDAWTGIWVSPRRFSQAGEIIAESAAGAGRSDAVFERGMQFWVGVDPDRDIARAKVAGAMEGFYKLPFASFEKYTPYGTPAQIAETIAPYIEAGCRWVNFVIPDDADAALTHALAIREALADVCR